MSIGNGAELLLVNGANNLLSNNISNGQSGTGTLVINSTKTNTIAGALFNGSAGNLAVTQSGPGTTILASAGDSYSGATTISAGTLAGRDQ